jgi:hypothetical protein
MLGRGKVSAVDLGDLVRAVAWVEVPCFGWVMYWQAISAEQLVEVGVAVRVKKIPVAQTVAVTASGRSSELWS